MKKAAHITTFVLSLLAYVFLGSGFAFAAESPISIHTTVLNPQTNTYVDSLGLTDVMYHPGDTVTFHVTLGNEGTNKISSATIENTFPDFVTFAAGPGVLKNNTLTLSVSNIDPKTTKSYAISAKVKDASLLPTDQGVVCIADKAVAKTSDGKTVSSSSSFCIEKGASTQPTLTTKGGITSSTEGKPASQKVFPAEKTLSKTPPTGPEALGFITMLLSATSGFLIRKIGKKF